MQSDELQDDGNGAAKSGTEIDAEGTDGDKSGNADDSYLWYKLPWYKFY